MPLIIDSGYASFPGKRPKNTDACRVSIPDMRSVHGQMAMAVVADTLDGRHDDGESARVATDTLEQCYFSTPREWDLKRCIRESFLAANHAVNHEVRGDGAATMSALVLKNSDWSVGHVGDTRVWLLRGTTLKQLTHDHCNPSMDKGMVITQACGFKNTLDVEILTGTLEVDDVFLLTTNGVHDALDGSAIMGCLLQNKSADEIAHCITQLALQSGSKDNVTACVLRIEKLPDHQKRDNLSDQISALPVRALPERGDVIDGYEIKRRIHNGRTTTVYKAVDQSTNTTVSLRFPNPKYADDNEFIDAFLREEWIAKRYDSPFLIKTIETGSKRRHSLYSVLEYHQGESLSSRIRRKKSLPVKEALYLACQLLECLDYLHKKGVTHRDIKPSNIYIDKKNKRLLLVGFGLSSIERLQDEGGDARANRGTKSYMAPELLQGHESDRRADLYSVGVTLYKMLTQHYPYGRIRSISTNTYMDFVPPERHNPDIPPWFSQILRIACSSDPMQRYISADEFLVALKNPDSVTPGPGKRTTIAPPKKKELPIGQWVLIASLAGALAGMVWWLLG